MKIVLTINEIPSIIDNESEKMNDMRNFAYVLFLLCNQRASEYDQDMPQSQTIDQPMAQGGRDTEQNTDSHMIAGIQMQ